MKKRRDFQNFSLLVKRKTNLKRLVFFGCIKNKTELGEHLKYEDCAETQSDT